jgi:hypothetical protein
MDFLANLTRWSSCHYLLLPFLCGFCSLSIADAPHPAPTIKTSCNVSNSHCATSDPASRKTTLIERKSGAPLWSIDQYFRFFNVSNDGQAILAQSGYANLAPMNATKGHVLFIIYRGGKPIQTVLLGTLFESVSTLERTASHLAWGNLEKIDAKDNAVFLLVDGRRVLYNLVTGLRVLE